MTTRDRASTNDLEQSGQQSMKYTRQDTSRTRIYYIPGAMIRDLSKVA